MIIQTDKTLPVRRDFDHYPTPRPVCDRALALLFDVPDIFKPGVRPPLRILDPGCGDGVWGRAAIARWPKATVTVDGCDIRDIPTPDGYRYLYRGDFCLMDHGLGYDLVIGNPPFRYAEMFVKVGLANLEQDGTLLYLLPLRFLEGKGRARGLFTKTPPQSVHVLGRVSFSGNKKTDDTPYAIYIWRQGWHGIPELHWIKS